MTYLGPSPPAHKYSRPNRMAARRIASQSGIALTSLRSLPKEVCGHVIQIIFQRFNAVMKRFDIGINIAIKLFYNNVADRTTEFGGDRIHIVAGAATGTLMHNTGQPFLMLYCRIKPSVRRTSYASDWFPSNTADRQLPLPQMPLT